MPEPDPHGVEPSDTGPYSVLFYTWPCGNKKHRKQRAKRIAQNLYNLNELGCGTVS